MMTETKPLRYRGYSSTYVDVATRGANEFLGVSVQYAVHPSNIGCFIFRFSAHGDVSPMKFKHLTYRDKTRYRTLVEEGEISQEINGIRLNKLALKVFSPAVPLHLVPSLAEEHNVWVLLAEWVAEQAKAEGFTLYEVDLAILLRDTIFPPVGGVKCILDLPKLDSPEEQAHALKSVTKPEPDPDEDGDVDEDEEEDAEWLN